MGAPAPSWGQLQEAPRWEKQRPAETRSAQGKTIARERAAAQERGYSRCNRRRGAISTEDRPSRIRVSGLRDGLLRSLPWHGELLGEGLDDAVEAVKCPLAHAHHPVHVDAPRLTPQADTAVHELGDAHGPAAVRVQEVEEHVCLRHVEVQRAEIPLHLRLQQLPAKFVPAQRPRVVNIRLLEEALDPVDVALHLRVGVLGGGVRIARGDLLRCGHKGAHQDVQHAEGHQEDVEKEEELVGDAK
mmetsp:Transcript_10174/g.23390  ORF Transcript_10174/g.23390 Transcript_10174/m.23390 type:complete len:244 (-) Transcript_10174:161-892(-)